MTRRLAVLIGVAVVTTLAVAQPQVLRGRAQLGGQGLADTYKNILADRKVAPDTRDAALQQFRALDPALQATLLAAMDEKFAEQSYVPMKLTPAYRFKRDWAIRPDLPTLLKPTISALWPSQGYPNTYTLVFGNRLSADVRVIWDGTELPTTYFGPGTPFFPNTLSFRVPAATGLGTNHYVKLRNVALGTECDQQVYRVVAPRDYRGYYGWQFSNFSDPAISWTLYRDFFGAAAVEYGDGAHKPSAQEWYDSTYKGVGGGGNCYGMSNSSLRLRNGNMTTFCEDWFAANPKDYCWQYTWRGETKYAVQEDQGGQLSAEMAETINDYWNHQDHKEAWNRVADLVDESANTPVVCFWGNNDADPDYDWGHAVVGYDTEISGNEHRIRMYDNNQPYTETETGGPHKSISYVNWTNSTFRANSYGSASRMICLSYNECMRAPHLPTEAGGPGAGTAIAVVEGGQVQQVEDETGKRFYLPNGQLNEDPATRIPDSMRFVPMVMGEEPYQGPAIFIFNKASNKSLTFTVAGAGQKRLSFFQNGSVFRAEFAGQGQLKLNRILTPTRALELPNPQPLQPSQLRFVAARAAERVYDLQNLNLGAAGVVATLANNGDSLDVQTAAAAQFDLRAETFANRQLLQATFRGIATQAGSRALLQPQDWNSLRNTTLNLNLRSLNNQQLQQLRIRPQ